MNRSFHGTSTASGSGGMAWAAGAGLAAGLAANFVRKAIMQAPTALAGDWDQALAQEHKAALALFDKLEQTEHATRRAMLFAKLKQALSRHAFEEENVIYPALRDHGAGDQAEAFNHDHGLVKQYLFDLGRDQHRSDWTTKLREFRSLFEKHMREEEEQVFPELKAQLSEDENHAVTMAMNKEGLKLA